MKKLHETQKMRERLDILLTERKLAKSRTAASVLIERGSVLVNGVVVDKPSRAVLIDAKLEVTSPLAFVSRAGEKLEHALSLWDIDVSGFVVADIGSSTGGFTDCLLKRGAKKVFAIDVGTNQLDETLRNDERVISIEQTDVRKAQLPELVDIATIDVSFISLNHVLGSVKKMLKENSSIIALVKPQFEVGPNQVDDRGVVAEESLRKNVLEKIKSQAKEMGLSVIKETTSPIVGAAGNIEFLLWLKN